LSKDNPLSKPRRRAQAERCTEGAQVDARIIILVRRSSASAGLATGSNADGHAEAATNDHRHQ
jgi:hypothetical protein